MRIALAEKQIAWEPIFVNLRADESKRPEYLALNPNGSVPTLVDGETVVYDSTVINEYLEDRFPDPPLLGRDPERRARIRMWEDDADNNFGRPAEMIFIHQKGWRRFTEEELHAFRARIREHLERLEKHLEGKTFLAGDFSLADIAHAPRIIMLEDLGVEVPGSHRNLRAYIKRLRLRPSLHNLER